MKVFSGGGAFERISVSATTEGGSGASSKYLLCEPLAEGAELIFEGASGDVLVECSEEGNF